MKVCQELCKATGLAILAGETEAVFAERVCDAVSKLKDEDFGKLSDAARAYFDGCIDPINKKEFDKLPKLDGFVAVAGSAPETVAAVAGAAKSARAASKPAAASKPETAAQAKKRKAKEAKDAKAAKVQAAKDAKAKKVADAKAAKEAKAKDAADKKAAKKAGKKAGAKLVRRQATFPGMPEGSRARPDSVAFKVRRAVVLNGPDMGFEDILKKANVTGEKRGGNGWNAYFNTVQALRIAAAEKAYKVPAK